MFRNGLQIQHILLLVLIVLLLFGARRLPELAQSVGKSMKIFKSEVKELRDEPAGSAGEPPQPGSTQFDAAAQGSGHPGGAEHGAAPPQPAPGPTTAPPGGEADTTRR